MTNTTQNNQTRNEAQGHHHPHAMAFSDPVCSMSTNVEGEFSHYEHQGNSSSPGPTNPGIFTSCNWA